MLQMTMIMNKGMNHQIFISSIDNNSCYVCIKIAVITNNLPCDNRYCVDGIRLHLYHSQWEEAHPSLYQLLSCKIGYIHGIVFTIKTLSLYISCEMISLLPVTLSIHICRGVFEWLFHVCIHCVKLWFITPK